MASQEMQFLSFDAPRKSLTLKTKKVPNPKDDEVLIKVAYSGVCGTDIHILEGEFPCKSQEPFTLGHEFVGVVVSVGSAVQKFQTGQHVAVDPNTGCRLCDFCHSGKYHLCKIGGIESTIGIFRDGGWATHAVVPESQVHLLPEGTDLAEAALAEPLSCLAHGLDLLNPINIGTKVLVIGAGIIGLLWMSVLHLCGHRKSVTVSEMQEKRRGLASKLGLGYNVTHPSEIEKDTFDLAVDCSGSGPAIESAMNLLEKGGRMCIFGVANPKTSISIQPFTIYKKELQIIGVNINPFTFQKGLHLVKSLGKSYLDYEKLGIKVFELSEYREALETLKKGAISKVIFKM